MSSGTLHILGLGPGDPELVTLKAARILGAAPVFAFFAKRGRPGHARGIATPHLNPAAEELRFDYPFTTDLPVEDPRYLIEMAGFYDRCAEALSARLAAGQDVALLCEGDPFLYGSAMYPFDRLRHRHPVQVVPGITAMSGCWSLAQAPMVHGDDTLMVLPATLDSETLAARLRQAEAAVVMKLGRHLPRLRGILEELGLTGRALYVERGTMEGGQVIPLAQRDDSPAPYFSLLLIPGRQGAR
ncbi:precorrin-2 C(20)-methyltransferase [Roseomonas marmotae]|uniref:Precorrin-2 C(20)-methyltransferase n=1 Tax=Roseomonas marmotae TaxID=2768161 RepID=A0ABS3KFN9_9PROT|nr:precorrin-2 C(20)-methyltransferase [Roseomonas marmotae]MBO1075156.1 precorrin-2 C(20)-methyltransferase [Roseomonas marmotae]QTI79734.1 precorrin-2 C(20)-methyltransferase [Roseomonas marmotae]